MTMLKIRKNELEKVYKTTDSVEVKSIQLNHFCMVVNDLHNSLNETMELVPSPGEVATCKNEQEIRKLSEKAINSAEMVLSMLKEAIEDLKGEEL